MPAPRPSKSQLGTDMEQAARHVRGRGSCDGVSGLEPAWAVRAVDHQDATGIQRIVEIGIQVQTGP